MAELNKLGVSHLRREAWVYVRQSMMTQVREHTESLARQYELVDRAQAMGWRHDQVRVVDEDLGRSGAEAAARTGFQSLVAAVGLGQVGIVIGIEVSRLARCNADWYHLLDLCSLTDTLIADADGLYHPRRLQRPAGAGLEGDHERSGTASAAFQAGRGAAPQGRPRRAAPRFAGGVGLRPRRPRRAVPRRGRPRGDRDGGARFDELGTAREVLLSLRADGLLLPRRAHGGSRSAGPRPPTRWCTTCSATPPTPARSCSAAPRSSSASPTAGS